MSLLTRTRKLNRILQKSGAEPVVFEDICNILSEDLDADVFVVSRKGKILGEQYKDNFKLKDKYKSMENDTNFSERYNDVLLGVYQTLMNLDQDDDRSLNIKDVGEDIKEYTSIVPIIGNRERLGTIVVISENKEFDDDDIVLLEYSSAIIGLEIMRSKQIEKDVEKRENDIVNLAIQTLSYSEEKAVEHIFKELDGIEGLLVASRVADKAGITRSVIVNALRKLESAGVIESTSLGMKGTRIKILNEKLLEKLDISFKE